MYPSWAVILSLEAAHITILASLSTTSAMMILALLFFKSVNACNDTMFTNLNMVKHRMISKINISVEFVINHTQDAIIMILIKYRVR